MLAAAGSRDMDDSGGRARHSAARNSLSWPHTRELTVPSGCGPNRHSAGPDRTGAAAAVPVPGSESGPRPGRPGAAAGRATGPGPAAGAATASDSEPPARSEPEPRSPRGPPGPGHWQPPGQDSAAAYSVTSRRRVTESHGGRLGGPDPLRVGLPPHCQSGLAWLAGTSGPGPPP
jgi:translation initiation factor IF-2